MFITFEGIEGSGKSTQARLLAQAIGDGAILTSEPGATALGRGIRQLLLDGGQASIGAMAETLLFLADRVQHVQEVIRPALEHRRIVICDRFSDSTIAYQSYGRGVPRRVVESLAQATIGALKPDVTFLLDLPVDVGLDRVRGRASADRMESEEREFHARVHAGYRKLAAAEPERWLLLDGAQKAELVADRVRQALSERGVEFDRGVR